MNLSLYSSRQEESIFIRKEARTWMRSGLINDAQLREMFVHADPDLRMTNLFFRILFFIFADLCALTLLALFVWLTGMKSEWAFAWTFIVAGATFYFLAEYAVTKHRFYRHGIEEALAVLAMAMICSGLYIGAHNLYLAGPWSARHLIILCLLFAVSAGWIYLRFGYLYAAFISLIVLCIIPFQLSLMPAGERVLLLLTLCLIFFLSVFFDNRESEDFRKERNTSIQACLLGGIYVTVNLQILRLAGSFAGDTGIGHLHPLFFPLNPNSFPPYLYWSSYVLTFLIPACGILWGIKNRKRLIINANLIFACMTLATNKSYLGLERYAWDPAIMGIMLAIVSIFVARWLKSGPDGKRSGFTGKDILKPETHGINLADVAAAFTPGVIDARQPQAQSGPYFDDGKSGGGGASRVF